jgi:hypothetical protein
MVSDQNPANDSGGEDLGPWNPANERDMGAIRRMHARYPKAFRDMNAEKQAKLVRIVDRAADVAEEMLDKEETKVQGAALAESVARTGAMLSTIRLKDEHHAADHNQRERHHADDLKVAQDNAKSNALSAIAAVGKTYLGLNPGKV